MLKPVSAALLAVCLAVPPSAFAEPMRPAFDQGVDAGRALRALREDAVFQAPPFKAAEQPVHRYRITHYPKDAGACPSIAAGIGAAVAHATGVRVLASVCEAVDEGGCSIAVSYEAPARLNLVTTEGTQGGFGAYPAVEACRAALAEEAAAFKAATALEPVLSFCRKDTVSGKDYWSIRIDAFGQAALKPDTRTVLAFTLPQDVTRQDFLGGIKEKLAAQGVDVRVVSWRGQFGYAEVRVSYYAAGRIALELAEPVKTDSKEQCRAMLAEFEGHLAGLSPEPLSMYCGNSSIGGWEIAWMYQGRPPLKTVKAQEAFKSYASCLAGRAKAAERYRAELGRDVVGALCSREVEDYAWKAILLER